ncbi:hypothetical protein J6590_032962 [Homalodisca vitripennis]|nr:hypothetical protein J6590_032962 [Homalodisca vitripennis]
MNHGIVQVLSGTCPLGALGDGDIRHPASCRLVDFRHLTCGVVVTVLAHVQKTNGPLPVGQLEANDDLNPVSFPLNGRKTVAEMLHSVTNQRELEFETEWKAITV